MYNRFLTYLQGLFRLSSGAALASLDALDLLGESKVLTRHDLPGQDNFVLEHPDFGRWILIIRVEGPSYLLWSETGMGTDLPCQLTHALSCLGPGGHQSAVNDDVPELAMLA